MKFRTGEQLRIGNRLIIFALDEINFAHFENSQSSSRANTNENVNAGAGAAGAAGAEMPSCCVAPYCNQNCTSKLNTVSIQVMRKHKRAKLTK